MNKYKDFSLHFTTKEQSLKGIEQKWNDFDAETLESGEVFAEESELIFHHCFLPESLVANGDYPQIVHDTIEFLDSVAEEQVRWFQTEVTVEASRYAMLRNLKRVGGVAIFVGEIKERVKTEYELVRSLGVDCILLP